MNSVLRSLCIAAGFSLVSPWPLPAQQERPEAIDYSKEIAPLLRQYCSGCHNSEDKEGKLVLESYSQLRAGGPKGPLINPGKPESSRLMAVLTGAKKPKMPPKGEPAPNESEIERIRRWIAGGAAGPRSPDRPFVAPAIKPSAGLPTPITALALSPIGNAVAVAQFKTVEIRSPSAKVMARLAGHPGKVTHLEFSPDATQLISASGVAGLSGVATIWDLKSGRALRQFRGHRDILYAATLSPDRRIVATGSYDRTIILWDASSGRAIRTLAGHNGAIFDLAFSRDGRVLASASADETVKIWSVVTGDRLDTLSQPTAEQYTVVFSPDDQFILAGGADNRVRVWRFVSRASREINPIVYSRYAHEGPVVELAYSADGRVLVSAGEDRIIKCWNSKQFLESQAFAPLEGPVSGLAVTSDATTVLTSTLQGAVIELKIDQSLLSEQVSTASNLNPTVTRSAPGESTAVNEQEPNDEVGQSATIPIPAKVTGVIGETNGDVDLYRFRAEAGERIVFEINAARQKSPLDSRLEILHGDGTPVQRVLLQAVRDSYITFRGIDSTTRDCRLYNWEEMRLNEYLYMNGEIVKLFLAPRGPDSGFAFYPHTGSRRCYFDTSATTHALHEPCYIVRAYPPGTKLIANGLPTFPIYYDNDDEGQRTLGNDSRLTFTAPAAQQYIVRVSDVRGFAAADFKYELVARPARPDFEVTIQGTKPTINAGSGKEFSLALKRIDDFAGEVSVRFENLPLGVSVTSPLVVEAGQDIARGVINALPWAPQPDKAAWQAVKVIGSALVEGQRVVKDLGNLGAIKIAPKPKVLVRIIPKSADRAGTFRGPDWTAAEPISAKSDPESELRILDDQSLLAAGPNPDKVTYQVRLKPPATPIRALRLEALGHDTLPAKAPGRAPDNGNFVLTGIRLEASSGDQTERVELAVAAATYSQEGFSPRNLLDSDPGSGWAIGEKGKDGKFVVKRNGDAADQVATLVLKDPLEVADGQELIVTLEHQSDAKQHNLGRFRISFTTDPVFQLPEPKELVIQPGETISATVQVERNGFDGRIQFEAINQNLPHGVIVDNIGLNGLLIVEGQTERTFFLTATDQVPETERTFHLMAKVENNQCSWPVRLVVRRSRRIAGE